MKCTVRDVLQYVEENDVKFVKLAFCDIFGRQKNLSIVSSELEHAFKNGVSFDASAVSGFMSIAKSDLLLFPDPSTLRLLPWRPSAGRVISLFCNIKTSDGIFFAGDTKYILECSLEKLKKAGLTASFGTDSEFYIFKNDEKGFPTFEPYDRAGYCDASPLDKCENLRRDIVDNLEALGMQPLSSHHEKGFGQNEIRFKNSSPLDSAHNSIMFKSAVKNVAERNGLFASFLPRPLANDHGSGMHINLSISDSKGNIFKNSSKNRTNKGAMFLEGVLQKIEEATIFFNPTANSYDRLGHYEAPKAVSWSEHNQSQLVVMPSNCTDGAFIKLRSPDSTCNPYVAFAVILEAGLSGIANKLTLRDEHTALIKAGKTLPLLPVKLETALEKAKKSEWVQSILNKDLVCQYCSESALSVNSKNNELTKFEY